jgi:hypothetical protein
MQATLVIIIAAHVSASVFWSGTTFALAKIDALGVDRVFPLQIASAIVSLASGAYLMQTLRYETAGRSQQVLACAALCALIALAIQAALVGGSRKYLRLDSDAALAARSRVELGYRLSAGLLALTLVGMATARYL